MNKYNSFQIKILMALLMVLDHIPHIPGLIPSTWEGIFHVITRCVGVWFAYVAVEGFIYTRSRVKYNVRLFFWAGVMILGNYLLSLQGIIVINNIFLTLAVGVFMLNILFYDIKCLSKFSSKKLVIIKIIRIILALSIFVLGLSVTEGGIVIIPFMLLTYLFRKSMKCKVISYLVFSLLLFFTAYVDYGDISTTINMLMFNSDFMLFTVIPFILMYNGERGLNNKFSKYFFYVFYPAHLWIIGIIGYFMT